MKTRLDVINRAMRRIGVKAEDENLTADQFANASEVLDTLLAELAGEVTLGFTTDIPDDLFIPLANLLAAEIAPDYGITPPGRGAALLRVLGVLRADDRPSIPAAEYF